MRIRFDGPFPAHSGLELTAKIFFLGEDKTISAIRALSDDELEAYRAAVHLIGSITAAHNLLQASVSNYNELVDDFNRLKKMSPEDGETAGLGEHFSRELNRRLANYLSSMRLFLDYSECRMKRTYGKASEEATLFKAATHREYDAQFGYRFASGLRNYSQHFGMPVGEITGITRLNDSGEPEHVCVVQFDVRELLANSAGSWGSVARRELESGPDFIDVADVIRHVPACLDRIWRATIEVDRPLLKTTWKVIAGTLEVQGENPGHSVVGRWFDDEGFLALSYVEPPPDWLAPLDTDAEQTHLSNDASGDAG